MDEIIDNFVSIEQFEKIMNENQDNTYCAVAFLNTNFSTQEEIDKGMAILRSRPLVLKVVEELTFIHDNDYDCECTDCHSPCENGFDDSSFCVDCEEGCDCSGECDCESDCDD